MQLVNRMPRKKYRLIKKAIPEKAKGTKEDHWRDFRMCETGMGQQVAQLLDSYMMMMMVVMMMDTT
jgi:hypothetical protein